MASGPREETVCPRLELPGKAASYWLSTGTHRNPEDALDKDLTCEIAVIGAGIAGITTAAILAERGADVILLDADVALHGVTGQTTAKVTSGHGLVYSYLIRKFGHERAAVYATAQQSAIDRVEQRARELSIDCGFKRTRAFVFTGHDSRKAELEREATAALSLGLPASFTESVPPEFDAAGAVVYENQARFDPVKYLEGLLGYFKTCGGRLFERTRAISVRKGSRCHVTTAGGSVAADSVVIATHFPFRDPALYFTRVYQRRAYASAVSIGSDAPEGLYFNVDSPSESSYRPHEEGKKRIAIVGAGDHKAGQGGDTVRRYLELEALAARHSDKPLLNHWSTQDCYTMDRIPIVGRLKPTSWKVLVATGFQGWGMTNGTVAGMLLSDRLSCTENPCSSLFDGYSRISAVGSTRFMLENANVGAEFLKGYGRLLSARGHNKGELEGCEAGLVKTRHRVAAMDVDDQGECHSVSPLCTHLGCVVNWNPAEESWDCPCHGSRFNRDGEVLHGPAARPLKQVDACGGTGTERR